MMKVNHMDGLVLFIMMFDYEVVLASSSCDELTVLCAKVVAEAE